MNTDSMEFEYITPGSPIEKYLASVGHEYDLDQVEKPMTDPPLFAIFEKGFTENITFRFCVSDSVSVL